MDSNLVEIDEQLRKIRNLKQNDLVELLDSSRDQISNLEKGRKISSIKIKIFKKLTIFILP